MSTVNGRPCTLHDRLPNITPELIYLDGPDQWTARGSIRGLHTRDVERTPIAGDLLLYEPFLLPGTLIIVDGRTNNVRFLLSNFQRRWAYRHIENQDVHLLELCEPPLGALNAAYLHFAFGKKSAAQRLNEIL